MDNIKKTKKPRAPTKKLAGKKHTAPVICPKCGHRQAIKSGHIQDKQRWKCKSCAYQFTQVSARGRPIWQKSLVVFLYSYGVSMHAIARIFHVQPSTVLKWVRSYSKDYHYPPEAGDVMLMELRDMQRYLKGSGSDSGTLCIAIKDETFKKNLGITISKNDTD